MTKEPLIIDGVEITDEFLLNPVMTYNKKP
jgi:hypothetical protein